MDKATVDKDTFEMPGIKEKVDHDKEAAPKKLQLATTTPLGSSSKTIKIVIGVLSAFSILAFILALVAVVLSAAHWTDSFEVRNNIQAMIQDLNNTVREVQQKQEAFVEALNMQVTSINNSILAVQDLRAQQGVFIETLNTQVASANDSLITIQNIQQEQKGFVETLNTQVSSLNNSIVTVQETQQQQLVDTLQQQETFVQTLNMKVASLNNSLITVQEMQQQQEALVETLNMQVASLNNSIVTDLSSIEANISTQADELGELAATVQVLSSNVTDLYEIGFLPNFPASSCNDISTDRPSGLYWIQTNSTNSPIQVYCDTERRSCNSCNSTGGWTRVANIDMTNPAQSCPDEFRLYNTTPQRVCGRPEGLGGGCASTTFPVHGIEYSRVCGRIVGYTVGGNHAFLSYRESLGGFARQTTIDGHYLDGISLTHGSPTREHIWSFVAALSDNSETAETIGTTSLCPCNRPDLTFDSDAVPPFVGNDYFCDTAISDSVSFVGGTFQPDDPLWDAAGCDGASSCCEFNNPPWFCKQLPQPTTDDIELRICEQSVISDVPFEVVEIFVN